MPTFDRVDASSKQALLALHQELPGGLNRIPDLARRREIAACLDQRHRTAFSDRLSVEDVTITAPAGHAIPLRLYRPRARRPRMPVIFFIHGGGMIMGTLDGGDTVAGRLGLACGALVVSVDYRLAPEHPYPAGLDDCVAALAWATANAESLGADPHRVVVFGGSAGGGLALATALRCRDAAGPQVLLVMAPYPMIDHTSASDSARRLPDLGVWDRSNNIEAWRWYLGDRPADGCASPAHAQQLAGLPPVFIDVGSEDIFLDESVTFSLRLAAAGVLTELHVYPGAYHASEELAPDAPLSRTIWAARVAALRRALGEGSAPLPGSSSSSP
ncbi:alpha/beta hydrolase [Streptomyces sp. NPDC048385]|uniref:alpha/beta hydrolase n=1 Tax=unclassified Streptomyces TaxID=2593676 RepID=UPI00341FF920